jgi:hypothetical protein
MRHYVSNEGVDRAGSPEFEDVRFIASTDDFRQAKAIKAALDDDERCAVIFRSLFRSSPGKRSSHESWHIDDDRDDSPEADDKDATRIGFDVFTAPKHIVDRWKHQWDRAALCGHITELLERFAQTGDPSGGA